MKLDLWFLWHYHYGVDGFEWVDLLDTGKKKSENASWSSKSLEYKGKAT